MNIERIDPDQRWSEAVVHNETVYYTSVPENPTTTRPRRPPTPSPPSTCCWRASVRTKAAFWMPPSSGQHRRLRRDERRPGRTGGRRQRAGALHGAGAADESEVQGGNQNHRRAVSLSADEKTADGNACGFYCRLSGQFEDHHPRQQQRGPIQPLAFNRWPNMIQPAAMVAAIPKPPHSA